MCVTKPLSYLLSDAYVDLANEVKKDSIICM